MENTEPRPALLRRLWLELLDGRTAWGALDIRPLRWGCTSYRIVVYPPGITPAGRRRVRVWRGWPLWGALLFMPTMMVVARLAGPVTGLSVAAVGYLTAGGLSFVAAGALRAEVRTAEVCLSALNGDVGTLVASRRIRSLGTAMYRADERLHSGAISATEHEAIWWQTYRLLGSQTSATFAGGRR